MLDATERLLLGRQVNAAAAVAAVPKHARCRRQPTPGAWKQNQQCKQDSHNQRADIEKHEIMYSRQKKTQNVTEGQTMLEKTPLIAAVYT